MPDAPVDLSLLVTAAAVLQARCDALTADLRAMRAERDAWRGRYETLKAERDEWRDASKSPLGTG